MRRWTSPAGSRCSSTGSGTRSTPATTRRASAASSSRADAMPPTWRSAPRSAPIDSRASRSGPTRSETEREFCRRLLLALRHRGDGAHLFSAAADTRAADRAGVEIVGADRKPDVLLARRAAVGDVEAAPAVHRPGFGPGVGRDLRPFRIQVSGHVACGHAQAPAAGEEDVGVILANARAEREGFSRAVPGVRPTRSKRHLLQDGGRELAQTARRAGAAPEAFGELRELAFGARERRRTGEDKR